MLIQWSFSNGTCLSPHVSSVWLRSADDCIYVVYLHLLTSVHGSWEVRTSSWRPYWYVAIDSWSLNILDPPYRHSIKLDQQRQHAVACAINSLKQDDNEQAYYPNGRAGLSLVVLASKSMPWALTIVYGFFHILSYTRFTSGSTIPANFWASKCYCQLDHLPRRFNLMGFSCRCMSTSCHQPLPSNIILPTISVLAVFPFSSKRLASLQDDGSVDPVSMVMSCYKSQAFVLVCSRCLILLQSVQEE